MVTALCLQRINATQSRLDARLRIPEIVADSRACRPMIPGRRSTIRPCSLPLLLLVLANAHGESCSGETSHGEGCSGEASSLLARKLETHPASTANDMTDDQKEHALRDVEEEASIFPDNATDGNTSGFGPLASRMEFIFLKLAQLETVVELQQVEIQECVWFQASVGVPFQLDTRPHSKFQASKQPRLVVQLDSSKHSPKRPWATWSCGTPTHGVSGTSNTPRSVLFTV